MMRSANPQLPRESIVLEKESSVLFWCNTAWALYIIRNGLATSRTVRWTNSIIRSEARKFFNNKIPVFGYIAEDLFEQVC